MKASIQTNFFIGATMLNKFTISMLALLVIAGAILFGGFSEFFGVAVTIIVPLLAVLAWYNNISRRRREKHSTIKNNVNNDDQDDGEYHNDFSKVPAGTTDPFQPPPRSIGYGYGDGGKSVMEDLERIGIKTTADKKSDNNE
ncbi:MAG: hypothetical protein ACXVLQ_16390 [Bacteriovorax sp.]